MALTTIGLALASFMQVLDLTIANVSLPTISGNLGGSANQATWVITSFAVSNAIALPLTGWLTRHFGERKLFVWATAAVRRRLACCAAWPTAWACWWLRARCRASSRARCIRSRRRC